MTDRYILVDGEPVKEPRLFVWAQWMESGDRAVARTEVGESVVSTVFLGLDHNFFGHGAPILFETLVLTGPNDGEGERYSTLEEARLGHERMVARVRGAA